MDREAKEVAELREVKKEDKEIYVKFVDKQEDLHKKNQEMEWLRRGYDNLDTYVKDKIKKMRYEILQDKGRLIERFLLMLRYMYQQYKTQKSRKGARPSGAT